MLEFLVIVLAIYAVSVAIYYAGGWIFEYFNGRYANRQIQQRGSVNVDRQTQISTSVKALWVLALCLGGGITAQRLGWTMQPIELAGWKVIGIFLLSAFLNDTWFYFSHRLMHSKPLVRWHRLHHSETSPSAWTTDYFSFPDALSQAGYYLVAPFILPIPFEVLLVQRLYDQVKAMIGHCGFEYFAGPLARWPFPFACTHLHDKHHEKFRVNFGNTLTFWDRVCGTLDSGYDREVKEFEISVRQKVVSIED